MRDQLTLNIAGFKIKIVFKKTEWEVVRQRLYTNIYNHYKPAIISSGNEVDHTIDIVLPKWHAISKQDNKYYIGFFKYRGTKKTTIYYSIGLVQFQLVIRYVLNILLLKSGIGFWLHASAVEVNNTAYLFLGNPGAGKSTAVNMLSRNYPALVDDMGIIKQEQDNFVYYQSSLVEKQKQIRYQAKGYPIGKIFLLRKKAKFRIKPVSSKERVLPQLLRQVYLLSPQKRQQPMQLALKFFSKFDDYSYLYFAKEEQNIREFIKQIS